MKDFLNKFAGLMGFGVLVFALFAGTYVEYVHADRTAVPNAANLVGTVGIANGGTATSTPGVTGGINFFDGTEITNSSLFQISGASTTLGYQLNLTAANPCILYSGICGQPYWLAPYYGGFGIAVTSQPLVTNQFVFTEFEVDQKLIVNQVCYVVGSASSGNVQMALYGPVVSPDSIISAPFVASTTSTGQGTINSAQCLSIGPSTLLPGQYFIGLQGDNGTGTYMRQSNTAQVTATWNGAFTVAYGNLPTVTATTSNNTNSAIPGFKIRTQKL